MIRLALLGKNISHSLSPDLYLEIYGQQNLTYKLFDYESAESIPALDEMFKQIDGLSITAPYKEHFLAQVEFLDTSIKKLNAINCIGVKDNTFVATNTDLSAMRRLLPNLLGDKKLLILGSGAMARVVTAVAKENKCDFLQWSRRETPQEFSKMNIAEISDGNVLVVNSCAREYNFAHSLPERAIFWDMNYRHQAHLERFRTISAQYIDGLNLLKGQAVDAAAFWSSLKN